MLIVRPFSSATFATKAGWDAQGLKNCTDLPGLPGLSSVLLRLSRTPTLESTPGGLLLKVHTLEVWLSEVWQIHGRVSRHW